MVLPVKNKGDLLRISSIFWANRVFISRCRVPTTRLRLSIDCGGIVGSSSRLSRLLELPQLILERLLSPFIGLKSLQLLP